MCGILKAQQDNTSLFLISLILAHPDTPHALSVTLLPLITNLIVSTPRQVRAVRIKAPLPSFSSFLFFFVFFLLLLPPSHPSPSPNNFLLLYGMGVRL